MYRTVKRMFALLLVLAMVCTWLPLGNARAAQTAAPALTAADYAAADLVFGKIEDALSAPAKKDASDGTKTLEAMRVVLSSDSYVEDSLVLTGLSFTWQTDAGIRCVYSPRMRKIQSELTPEKGIDRIVNEPVATKGNSPTGKQVYLIGPYYGYDENFTNQYKNEARRVAAAIGDTDGYTLYSGKAATVDKVAQAVSDGAVVFFDSHGATDYENPRDEYDCITGATCSYLCLTSAEGLTQADYNDGALYDGHDAFVNGATIANHMQKQSPGGILWMAICLGMGTDTMFKPLREMGVEVVYGYSESVTFAGEYLYEETFWGEMIQGKTVAESVATMKDTWGNWDWSVPIARYYGYYDGYATISQARQDFAAFPVVVSDVDAFPGQRTASGYGADALQTVRSTYTLGQVYEVTTPTDPRQILEDAYALGANEELYYTPTLTGTVTRITEAYSTTYKNITVIMEVAGCEDLPIKCYRLQGNGVDQISVGDTITVTGTVVNYQHSSGDLEVEFAQGCTLVSRTPAGEEPAPEQTATLSFVVPAGVEAIGDMTCGSAGITLPTAASPSPEYTFAGWATEPVTETQTPPELYTGRCTVSGDITLYAVYVRTEGGDGGWNLVTSQAQLSAGTQVIIAAAKHAYALSTTQNNNNRAAAAITKIGNSATFGTDVQILTLEEGTAAGSYAFQTGNGYLYTNNTGANRLQTQSGLDAYASWQITVAASGVATVKNVGNGSRGWLRFNASNSPQLFSCYSSGQDDIVLYAASGKAFYTSSPVTCNHAAPQPMAAVAPTCDEAGREAGLYCPDCQTFVEGGQQIPALGHSYETVVTPPTATNQGYTTYTCSACSHSYVGSYTPALGNAYTVSFAVPQGVAAVGSMACDNSGIDLPTPDAPTGYSFLGWCEAPVSQTQQKPQVLSGRYYTQTDITLYPVYSYTEGNGNGSFTLVTNASQLTAGAQVIIAAAGYDKAMSKTQNGNNRAAATVTKTGNTLTYSSDTAVLELRQGTKAGTFSFYDPAKAGYLYAASSSSNYLRTEGNLSANSSWKITVDPAGNTSILAQGSNTRNVLQYNLNNGTPLFSCYSSASQNPVSLYVKSSSTTYYTSLDATLSARVAVGKDTYATIAEALQHASSAHITLLTDITETVTVSADLYLDLNGCILTGDLVMAGGAKLYLFDSATADYTAQNRGGIVGSIQGDLASTMNTPASYGHNYKYLTILETNGMYSAHRIYLAVQSVTLVPGNTGIRYKTVFKCNELVAGYVESYRVCVAGQDYIFGTAVGGTNTGIIDVGNILDARDPAASAANAATRIPLAPVVVMQDGLQTRVEATQVDLCLMDVVKQANDAYATLTATQQKALQYMYAIYAPVMSTWDPSIIGNIKKSI